MWNPIPGSVKRAWDTWNIRSIILLSLSLQTFLILCGPLRKKTSRGYVIFFLWSSYLLADWAANFVVGQISNTKGEPDGSGDNENLLAFWAPFLLVHLGGPDTITAFALEDNALWLRHLIGLIFQVFATAYVFAQTIPSNKLWIPIICMFLAGIIKYAERTRALYLASLGRFRESMLKEPDPGPNYAKLMEEYSSKREARLPTRIEMTGEPDRDKETRIATRSTVLHPLSDFEVVQHAYRYFNIFKGLIVDIIFSFRERDESRNFFHYRTAEEALKVILVELNFIYEVLYTKALVVHNRWGYFFRFSSFASVVVAFVLFVKAGKGSFRGIDIGITYTLLIGAVTLDAIAFLMAIFSDRTAASVKENSRLAPFFNAFLSCKMPRWSLQKKGPFEGFWVMDTPLLFRRWSESIAQYNLITYCVRDRTKRIPEFNYDSHFRITNYLLITYGESVQFWRRLKDKAINYAGIKALLDNWLYVERNPFVKRLWNLIFTELLEKSKEADDAETIKRISLARGTYALEEGNWGRNIDKLARYIDDVDFDESLILWHIATELCYRADQDQPHSEHREFSKLLSDYMLYLLVMQPTMMSAVAGIGQIRFRDTCAEATNFFDRRGMGTKKDQEKVACNYISQVNTDVKPVTVKGDRSKSVLFDASILAQELKEFKDKWKLLTSVWIEMLAYAASHCRADTHAQRVSKGGEFISLVWLLMAHFGLGEQFQINEGHARAKLIVGK